jgi:conjugal transfer pilus assembly protein TraK
MIPLKQMKQIWFPGLCSLLCLCVAPAAQALQALEVSDGGTAYAKISADDLTRLTINNGRIASWHVPKGKLVIQKNAKSGELYVRPLSREVPVSLFVTSERGSTYAITLMPVKMPAETILLNEARPKAPPSIEHTGTRDTTIKDLMMAMAADHMPPDMEVRESSQSFSLWQGARLTLMRAWLGASLMGERFDLTNTGKSSMRLVEQELFKPGVLAISIEKHELAPSESTRVFVVRYLEDD